MIDLPRTFSALSDPTRLAVVEHLLRNGEVPAGDLVALAEMSAPAVSRHLKVLRSAGVVVQRAEGTRRYYAVQPAAIQAVADWTLSHRAFWEAGMDRLERILSQNG